MELMVSTTTKNDLRNVVIAPDPREKHIVPLLKDEERQTCEIWSRVMGYHRPVSHWNTGKKQEFADRKYFNEPKEVV
jgi:hypothetical protein